MDLLGVGLEQDKEGSLDDNKMSTQRAREREIHKKLQS